jgi:hypothetical protein
MTLPQRFLHSTLVLAIAGFSASPVLAAQITSWNTDNVDVGTTPDVDGNYFSTIYDKAPADPSASTNGYIKFDLDEGASPGLKVVNNAVPLDSGNPVDNCIMAAGDATCNGPFQSGKRFKLDQTGAGPIDLVFDLSSDPLEVGNDGLYRVFQKYGNNTDSALGGFSIGLGFGVGGDFVSSTDGDGLSFVDFGDNPKGSEFSSLFAEGLFGTDEERGRLRGYFSGERSGFNLSLTEDLFQSTGLFGGEYGYEALFGDWMSYSMTPDGYFYDDDGDLSTDAVLMAHFDEASGKWIMNRGIDANGEIETLASGNEGTQYATVAEVEAALLAQNNGVAIPSCSVAAPGTPCLAGVDAIEDLAKFNVTDFINLFDFDPANQNSFTMRISAYTAAVPEPGTLALFATGLGVMLVRRRTNQRKGMTA